MLSNIRKMSTRWRIYCTEVGDEGWQYIWSDTAPTECPNNSGHSININSISQIEREVPLIRIQPHTRKIRSKNLIEIGTCYFDPENYPGTLRRVKILSYLDNGATSYDFEVFDRDNNVSLVSTTFTNANNKVENNFTDVILTPPTGSVVMGFNIKKTGGGNKKYIRIEEISLWFGVKY